ncbi:MAG: hypothetical protein RMZ41_001460 [Nostoc sp. DedVER02]|uniref:hypothetical protein n=1 Tax=unclassified Nostoc TaxID=2593658 RepID=UPI002AD3944B|nr:MULTISPECIES: hypothetical protein [unclassified Nostoc]MDZ7987171.1 hypothetical protein [Nostoc sp. DedVER02]MDZ8110958.1 hypothetical protein [Nostoc sp. DedVER01b]
MNFLHNQFIQVFTEIEQNYSTLFTEEDRASLAELRKNLLEQQSLEQQSDAIARWCQERPQIYNQIQNALRKLQNNSSSASRGAGGYTQEPNTFESLNNIVRPSEPSSQDKPSSQSEPSCQDKPSSQSEPPSQS